MINCVLSTETAGIARDGNKNVTAELQKLIDEAASLRQILVFHPGVYRTGPLFLHSDMQVFFEPGAVLLASQDEKDYPKIRTRIAGIEMEGYPGILNILSSKNVRVSGPGTINGQGSPWYEKYWGKDGKGGMRKVYEEKGLRWACDYDCLRPKNFLIQDSERIEVNGLTLLDSPFWNLHVLYSSDVKLTNLTIRSDNPNSPSTDGIDIDSSKNVTISSCSISTNDDCISLKSGRDQEGFEINRPTENVLIEDCTFYKGYGLSIGSELSGGISSIEGRNLTFKGTSCGFRIKSAPTRKGYVRSVHLSRLKMIGVTYPFYAYLNWNPHYNEAKLPEGYRGEVPNSWKKLLSGGNPKLLNTEVSDLFFEYVRIRHDGSEKTPSCLFTFRGFEDNPIRSVRGDWIDAETDEFGTFVNCEEPVFRNCSFVVTSSSRSVPGSFDNR